MVNLWANGLKTEVSDHELIDYIKGLNAKEQIEHIIEFVKKSALCEGYRLKSGENIAAMLPHHLECITSIKDGRAVQTVAFSNKCSVVLSRGKSKRCPNCAHLKKMDCRRKKRRQNRSGTIHPKCNRRYLEEST